MKRCNRFLLTQNQPYLQFSFEKSLRKYQKIPNKKIKMQHPTSQNTHLSHNTSLNKSLLSEEADQPNSISSIDPPLPIQLKPLLIQSSPIRQMIVVSEQYLNQVKVDQSQIIQPINTQKDQGGQQEEQSLVKEQQQMQNQQQIQPQQQQSNIFKPSQKDEHTGGRFHLNNNISISKRSLQRLAKWQNQEYIVNQLLRNRAYLENERGDISERLREYMSLK